MQERAKCPTTECMPASKRRCASTLANAALASCRTISIASSVATTRCKKSPRRSSPPKPLVPERSFKMAIVEKHVPDNSCSMNEASDRDPFNNNCYGTLVDAPYKNVKLPVLDVRDFNERIIRGYEEGYG